MKLGVTISTFETKFGPIVFRDSNIENNLGIIKELGFTGVDLFIDRKTDDEVQYLKDLFIRENIEVSMMAAIFLAESGMKLSSTIEKDRLQAISDYKSQIKTAQKLGAQRMPIGFLRGAREEGDAEDKYLERLADSISELLVFAKKYDVVLCLEPINRYEINTLNTVSETIEFINKFNLSGLKILADTFHMNIEDASIEDSIIRAGELIDHVHMADSNRLAPGWGHLNFDSIINTLKMIKYNGYLVAEVFPKPDSIACARQAAEYLKQKVNSPG